MLKTMYVQDPNQKNIKPGQLVFLENLDVGDNGPSGSVQSVEDKKPEDPFAGIDNTQKVLAIDEAKEETPEDIHYVEACVEFLEKMQPSPTLEYLDKFAKYLLPEVDKELYDISTGKPTKLHREAAVGIYKGEHGLLPKAIESLTGDATRTIPSVPPATKIQVTPEIPNSAPKIIGMPSSNTEQTEILNDKIKRCLEILAAKQPPVTLSELFNATEVISPLFSGIEGLTLADQIDAVKKYISEIFKKEGVGQITELVPGYMKRDIKKPTLLSTKGIHEIKRNDGTKIMAELENSYSIRIIAGGNRLSIGILPGKNDINQTGDREPMFKADCQNDLQSLSKTLVQLAKISVTLGGN